MTFQEEGRMLEIYTSVHKINTQPLSWFGSLLIWSTNVNYDYASPQFPIPADKQPNKNNSETMQVGLHVILSTTSPIAPTCLILREWCIVATRNTVERNKANAEAVRQLGNSKLRMR
jgi:hypothetical protein